MARSDDKKMITEARSFISGVLLLSLSTVAVKVIGLAFKIPMLSLLGTDGMGYFNSAYEIYALLCVIATAGLPTALSMLISSARAKGEGERIRKTFRSALALFTAIGMIGSAVMALFSQKLAEAIGNPDARLSIVAIAPTLLIICISSAIRGYAQGFEYMSPTALSQLMEATGKLAFGVIFARLALERGLALPTVAAFAVAGIGVGAAISLVYLLAAMGSKKIKRQLNDCTAECSTRRKSSLRELVSVALPITLGSAVIGLTRIIDMTQIMRGLQDIGVPADESNRIYGAYTTLALPVFSLVPSLIAPISMALVPGLSAAIARRDLVGERNITESSLRYTSLLATPASFALALYSEPILSIIFPSQHDAIELCAPLLSMLGGSVLFSCLMTTTNALLQSYRKQRLPIISMSLGVALKLVSTYALVRTDSIGVMGAPIGSLICNIAVTYLNLYFLWKYSDVRIETFGTLLGPLIASLASVGGGFALYRFLLTRTVSTLLPFGVAVFVSVFAYIAIALMLGCITEQDIRLLPFGARIINMKKDKNKTA